MKKYIFFALFLAPLFSQAQKFDESGTMFADPRYSRQIKIAADSIQKMMTKRSAPGLSVCVSVKGKIIWAQGFGYADRENKTAVRLNTKFRIGSVSKTITAIALAQLAERGKLNFDSAVTAYVPYWPEKKYVITVRQLAAHTAGIRHYGRNEFYSAVHYDDVRSSLSIFDKDSLQFVPGTKHQYSSYGYNLLSAAVEGASGRPFLNYLSENIFLPFGMDNTVPDYNDSLISNRTNFYELKKNRLVNATYVDNSNKWGSGGLLGTPYDLVKLGNALLSKTILSAATLAEIWTPVFVTGKVPNNYGIGFRIEKDKEGRMMMSHGGTSVGGRTFFIIYPTEEVIMAMTYNLLPNGYDETEFSHIFVSGN